MIEIEPKASDMKVSTRGEMCMAIRALAPRKPGSLLGGLMEKYSGETPLAEVIARELGAIPENLN